MKNYWMLVVWSALLLLGSCSKEEEIPQLLDRFDNQEIYPTAIRLKIFIDPNATKILEKGVLVGVDSTKLSIAAYDYDTTKHYRMDLIIKNLKPSTLYYIQPFVKTEKGIINGQKLYKITTSVADVPTISTGSFSIDGDYNATLRGVVISNGGAPIEEAGFIVGGNKYMIDPANLQADTLKRVLSNLNVSVAYKFYAKNKYGTATGDFHGSALTYKDKTPTYKWFEVSATSERIEAGCTFFGHDLGLGYTYLLISDKPIVKPSVDKIDLFDSEKWGWWTWGHNVEVGYGPTKWSVDYGYPSGKYTPNTTYYIRVCVSWFDLSEPAHADKYFWTEQKMVVTPSVIVLDKPRGASSERKLMQQVG